MPFFNLGYFNQGNVLQQLFQLPTPSPYSDIKLYGGGIFDDVWVEKYVRTQTQINELDLEVEPQWSTNTIFLAHFNNNLQAGNIINLPNPIDKWIILRKGKNESKFTKIAEVEANVETYIDRKARSKEEYIYQLIPLSGDLLGEPLVSDIAPTDFVKVVLLDDTTTEGYEFCYDMSISEIATEEDLIIEDTKGKFQTVLKGNKEVSVGTIGMIATSNSITTEEINQDVEFLNQLRGFILNGKPKLIKFPKGLIYRVWTSNFSMSKKDGTDAHGNQIYRIGFEFREVGEV